MGNQTYQQRRNQDTRIPVGQRRAAGGRVLEDNRAAFAAKQLKQTESVQRMEEEEDERLKEKSGGAQLAKKDDEETAQAKFADPAPPVQREEHPAKPNNTGLPDKLKNGIESLSGLSMDNVKVHYNSAKPAQLNALAYAQGTDIHVGPGQEKHLPHEAWHVVQQAQGRVRPTMQMKDGQPVNDDTGLENEADVMGREVLQMRMDIHDTKPGSVSPQTTIQRQPKHFPSLPPDHPLIDQHKATVGQIIDHVDAEVAKARQMSLNWSHFLEDGRAHLKNWAMVAQEYYNDSSVVPDFLHARFGYAIETLACESLEGRVFNGLEFNFQVTSGNTRPDIVLCDTASNNEQIAWIDITSGDSVNHILGKDGSGWRTRPFVYEILYEPLVLNDVLKGMKDPVFREYGEYMSYRNQILHEKANEEENRLRDALNEMSSVGGDDWQTGYGNASTKRDETKSKLGELGVNLGPKNIKAAKGALIHLGINPGPFGFQDTKTSNKAIKAHVDSVARTKAKEPLAQLDQTVYENIADEIADKQDVPFVADFFDKLTQAPNHETLSIGIAVNHASQRLDSLLFQKERMQEFSEDQRALVLINHIEEHLEALPAKAEFHPLREWGNAADEILAICENPTDLFTTAQLSADELNQVQDNSEMVFENEGENF